MVQCNIQILPVTFENVGFCTSYKQTTKILLGHKKIT